MQTEIPCEPHKRFDLLAVSWRQKTNRWGSFKKIVKLINHRRESTNVMRSVSIDETQVHGQALLLLWTISL